MNSTKACPTEPPPPVLNPDRLYVPQAHSKFIPEEALQEIAQATSTPLSALGQLTISSSAAELWHAVKNYLATSPVPTGHACVPLHVPICEPHKDDDVSPGTEDEDAENSEEKDDGAEHKTHAARPGFCLAPCNVDFLWPPPAHLTAEALLARREADPDASILFRPDEECCDDGLGDGTDRDTFHLFYYNIGGPKATFEHLKVLSEMLLVSSCGTRPLVRFCNEVIVWNQRISQQSDLCSRFPLYRFKIECESGMWANEGLKRSRPADSVILSGHQMDTILCDITNFRSEATRSWYFRHGLPYRRSYLFFGPPGTGKTSTVRVIASKFELSCCSLSMANQKFSNQTLGDALSTMPKNALLVLEDVDALFNEDRTNKMDNGLTFSGLLNALDGLVSVEGLLTVMTTNHIERLERALIRGGRVDRRFRFDMPGDEELKKLFMSFYPGAAEGTAVRFVEMLNARREGVEARAVSTLQQLFIETIEHTAEECVEEIDAFFDRHFPQEDCPNRQTAITEAELSEEDL